MKVALVHDFLTQMGGAERVLKIFCELFPSAPIFTLFYDREKTHGVFDRYEVRASFLQKIPGVLKHYKWCLPLLPFAIGAFDFSDFDLVLSDSSAFAKGVNIKNKTVHICYCHTPTRYLWQDMESYLADLKYPRFVKRLAKFYLRHFLRQWDYKASQRPNYFLANSRTVQGRIKKYYHRNSEVIYPPVDTSFFRPETPSREPRTYFFTASRLEPYKKIDLVIEACSKLNLPLLVAGEGSEFSNLKAKARNTNIKFLGRVSDEQLKALYGSAKAFIFPALEDAGIMAMESLACGTPVIAYAQGGSAEIVEHGKNGILIKDQTVESLCAAIEVLSEFDFDPTVLRQSVKEYDTEKFKSKIEKIVRIRL